MADEKIISTDAIDPNKKTSAIGMTGNEDGSFCYINGKAYGVGSVVCNNRVKLECRQQGWVPIGTC
jgi:hypothetical protein